MDAEAWVAQTEQRFLGRQLNCCNFGMGSFPGVVWKCAYDLQSALKSH